MEAGERSPARASTNQRRHDRPSTTGADGDEYEDGLTGWR